MNSASPLARADRACAQLRQDGQPVTFTAVAAITGIGRTTLYRNPALRAIVEDHRHRAAGSGTLAGITDEIALLHTALDALADRARRHEANPQVDRTHQLTTLTGQYRIPRSLAG